MEIQHPELIMWLILLFVILMVIGSFSGRRDRDGSDHIRRAYEDEEREWWNQQSRDEMHARNRHKDDED